MMEIRLNLDVPRGYKFIGYRKVQQGEYYLLDEGIIFQWLGSSSSCCEYFIFTKDTLRYRVAVMCYDNIHYLTVVTGSEVHSIVSDRHFVRWVHNDWQEVDI